MKTVIFWSGSVPVHSSFVSDSPSVTVPLRHDSFCGSRKVEFPASLHLEGTNTRRRISREVSESERKIKSRLTGTGSQTLHTTIPEAESESLTFAEKCFDRVLPPASEIAVEESEFSGVGSGSDRDGFGTGGSSGGSSNNDHNNSDQSKINAYYQQMLKSNPNDPLLHRNYAKFLHEVRGDSVKAEEHYGRAILESPGDGELLSLYGKLIWDTQRDGDRAKSYFDQAINASPDDCIVMGSYAHFMWEAEEDDDEEECRTEFSAPATVDV